MLTRLSELAVLFLKLGAFGFGGPAVHIGAIEREVVVRRGWLTPEHYLDLIGATHLIPGPNSTEMAIHVGYHRAGVAGLFVAGTCFILPAVAVTTLLAWMYVEYGSLPQIAPLFAGIQPVVLAIIITALLRLGKTAGKNGRLIFIGIAVCAASLAGVGEVLSLFVGGAFGMLLLRWTEPRDNGANTNSNGGNDHHDTLAAFFGMLAVGTGRLAARAGDLVSPAAVSAVATTASDVSVWKLGLFFLKIGAVLYGGGYVLMAYLEGGLVDELGWLTQEQLLDAIAIGQFTPGPILSTATFIGYVLAGLPGAAIATLGIFLPSFFFVLIVNPLIPRLRRSQWMGAFLDAVNVAAVGLMVAVTWKLGNAAIDDWRSALIAGIGTLVAIKWNVSTVWLVVGGACSGWILGG